MESLKIHIKKNIIKKITSNESLNINKKIQSNKKELNTEINESFNEWLKNIRISMHRCKYRQVINEIESKKQYYKCLSEEHWKYQCIEIDAIFKILRKKFINHPKEIAKENSYQNHSCLFWLNQIFLILEQLVLEFRPDLNNNLDFNNISIMKPIQYIIECHIKCIFLLMIFSQYNHQIQEICSYLSIIDKFLPYMAYTSRSNSYIFLQRIQLLKVKLFIENCDYINAMHTLEKNIYLCFDYIKILGDDDFNIHYYDIKDEKYQKYYEDKKSRKSFKIKIKKEKEEETPNKKYIKKNSKINSSSPKKGENNKLNIYKFNDKSLLILSTFGSKNTNNNNDSNKEYFSNEEVKSNKNVVQIKRLNIKNIINNKPNEEENKKDVFITQIKKEKRIDEHSKNIIKNILSNIALNFYLRAAIFEHMGNIACALDSYKEVEWFSMKFLSNKLPNFVKYMSNLLNCAWNNYNLIAIIKIEKEKKRKLRLATISIEEEKGRNKLLKNIVKNSSLSHFKFHKLKNNEKKLKKYLDNLGQQLYKEEEIRNINLFNQFSKTGYILSTVKMINNLLSSDFKHVLKEMQKVEITKQKEEIKDLINKTIVKHKKSLYEQRAINSKVPSRNINILKKENTIINKNNINKDVVNFHFRKEKLISLIKSPKRNNSDFKNNITNYGSTESINKKISISCKNSDINKKKFTFVNFKEKHQKNNENKIRIKYRNYSNEEENYFKNKNFDFKKYNIAKINSKISTGFTSSRTSHTNEKVENFPIDKEFFNKNFINKKYFLDKVCNKELNFQKNLLKTKSCDREFTKTIDEFNLKKVINDAELFFNTLYEIAKSNRRKRNLNNLIKQNYTNINKNNTTIGLNKPISSLFHNNNGYNFNTNEMKLKEINVDYNKILDKRNELIKKRKLLYFG